MFGGDGFTGCRGTFRGEKIALEQQFDVEIAFLLGALGATDEIVQNSSIDGSRDQGFRIVKSDIFVTMTGKTTAEGPILFGVACNLPLAADVGKVLQADPQDKNADNARGKGTFIKMLTKIGLVPTVWPNSDHGEGSHYTVHYGKNGWSIPEGQSLVYWARNNDSSALTTGTSIQISAEHFGVWLDD